MQQEHEHRERHGQQEQEQEREACAGRHGSRVPHAGQVDAVARWLIARSGPLPRWLVVYLVLGAGAVAVSKLATGEVTGWALYLLVSATPNLVESIRRYLAEQHREELEAARESAAIQSGIYVRQAQSTSRLRALDRGDDAE